MYYVYWAVYTYSGHYEYCICIIMYTLTFMNDVYVLCILCISILTIMNTVWCVMYITVCIPVYWRLWILYNGLVCILWIIVLLCILTYAYILTFITVCIIMYIKLCIHQQTCILYDVLCISLCIHWNHVC